MAAPRVLIVSPALADANNGNWRTASRWQRFLAPVAQVEVARTWDGAPVDALVALHARRSGDAVVRFAEAHPRRPLAVVLTGTDLYRDLPAGNALALHAVQCASHLVVLQAAALDRLDPAERARARVILQSAARVVRPRRRADVCELVAVGHLRDEKDPLTLMAATRALPADAGIEVVHVGEALDPALGTAARRTMTACPRYRWLGGLDADATRERIAGAHALVHMSRVEGGAHAVIEAVRSEVPVLASRIDGNVGLLGADYAGYFEPGDSGGLAALMQRFARDAAFAARLRAHCVALGPRFAPEAEAQAVRALLRDMGVGGDRHEAPRGAA